MKLEDGQRSRRTLKALSAEDVDDLVIWPYLIAAQSLVLRCATRGTVWAEQKTNRSIGDLLCPCESCDVFEIILSLPVESAVWRRNIRTVGDLLFRHPTSIGMLTRSEAVGKISFFQQICPMSPR